MSKKATNAYGKMKGKRRDIKIKTADYTMQEHIDEGAVFSNKGATSAVQIQLLASQPGKSVTLEVDAACPFRAHPATVDSTGEKVSASAGTLLAAGKYVTCSTVGGRITLVCEKKGEWKAKDPVASWVSE